ncbi:MAG: hypothetical protein WCQ90_11945 [Deltaproteobacteria bacterium]
MGGKINLLNKSTQLNSFIIGIISTTMAVGWLTTSAILLLPMMMNSVYLDYGKDYTEKPL